MEGSYEFFNLYLNKEYQFQFNVQTYSQSINARAQLQYFNRGNKKKTQKFKQHFWEVNKLLSKIQRTLRNIEQTYYMYR